MTVWTDRNGWRRALAIGILPFAALGVAGCDNTEPADGGGEEQEMDGEQEDD
ncbi:hypothetical protein GCM10011374_16480 [Kocuria dechangensis]|uniref:Uncharacterized protein n=1 Tax=Kocuria dechangensis TaxID=1176249 RepID=A0A917GQC8_9MICC|nr:hypothetical protein [Kocuria dechangensis]GGG54274.1 hypothetical protein GCM10011374_16480 [Kocuria dechangensis]